MVNLFFVLLNIHWRFSYRFTVLTTLICLFGDTVPETVINCGGFFLGTLFPLSSKMYAVCSNVDDGYSYSLIAFDKRVAFWLVYNHYVLASTHPVTTLCVCVCCIICAYVVLFAHSYSLVEGNRSIVLCGLCKTQ